MISIIQPLWFAGFFVALVILFTLFRKKFLPKDEFMTQVSSRKKAFFLTTRIVILLLLFLALANVVVEEFTQQSLDQELTVIIDESPSMELLETSQVDDWIEDLRSRVPTTVIRMDLNTSPIGSQLLNELQEQKNIVLVSDGQVTQGPSLYDIVSYANSRNSTVNALKLQSQEADASVRIDAPQRVIEGTSVSLEIAVESTRDEAVHIEVLIDGEVEFTGNIRSTYVIERAFTQGEHIVIARIVEDDYFSQNNEFSKTIQAVSKPAILHVTKKSSGVDIILDNLYETTRVTSLPSDLSAYQAVIIEDARVLSDVQTQTLSTFTLSGGGVVVLGGKGSFENGDYSTSSFETLLPVRTGVGQRQNDGGANIVLAIDMSSSTQGSVEFSDKKLVRASEELQSLQRGLAVSVVSDLNPSNAVGVLGFTYPFQTKRGGSCSGACVIHNVAPLRDTKQDIIDKIVHVNMSGGTSMRVGMEGSLKMLQGSSGAKNVIFISDGITNAQDEILAIEAAKALSAQGGRVFAVQAGDSAQGKLFLRDLARAGSGVYFDADRSNKLVVFFGEPVDIEQGDAFDIVIVDAYHFITDDPIVSQSQAVLYGYNQVVPKPGSRLLVSSNGGDPILTVWNYGVGRVAAVTAFEGNGYGALIDGSNSKLLTRTVNWAIGDPGTDEDISVVASDVSLGETVLVQVTTDRTPTAQGMIFTPRGNNVYVAEITPTQTGIFTVLDTTYSVNYAREYQGVGTIDNYDQILAAGGGKTFTQNQVDELVEYVASARNSLTKENISLSPWLLLFALIVYLFDVGIRKLLGK